MRNLKSYTKPTPTVRCPYCPRLAHMTTWRPPEGYDVGMRQYKCPRCSREYYLVFLNLYDLAQVDKVVEAREVANERRDQGAISG